MATQDDITGAEKALELAIANQMAAVHAHSAAVASAQQHLSDLQGELDD